MAVEVKKSPELVPVDAADGVAENADPQGEPAANINPVSRSAHPLLQFAV